jgi:hypothetical protein
VADLFDGADPAAETPPPPRGGVPIRETAEAFPPRLSVNLLAPGVDNDRWRIPDDLLSQAAFVTDGSGVRERPEAVLAGPFAEAQVEGQPAR